MAKNLKKIDTRQLNLFEYLAGLRSPATTGDHEGQLNIAEALRRALNQAIKEFPGSRYEIAGAMSHSLGAEITKSQLDSWTAESKSGNRIPAEYIPAFCDATQNQAPLIVLNQAAGNVAVPGPEALRAEVARLADQEKAVRQEKRKRQLLLNELEKGGFTLPGDRRREKGRRTYD